jgi:4-amino-4-deoxy-L-arabinose transferase-like glycosyltransferase
MPNVFNQSVWGNEAFFALVSQRPILEIFKVLPATTIPPLWNIIEHFSFQFFGISENTIRSLSFAFYLITSFFVFKICRIFFSRKTSLLATFITLLNPYLFSYAFEGGPYSLITALVTLSMYFFVKTFFDEGDKWTRNGYLVATLLALYSNHLVILVVFIQVLWWLYEFLLGRKKTARKFFKTFLLLGIFYLPCIYILYKQVQTFASILKPVSISLDDYKNILFAYLGKGTSNPFPENPLSQVSLYFVFSIFILRKWWRVKRKSIFLLIWFMVPLLFAWGISQRYFSVFDERYLLFVIPAGVLILVSARGKLSFIPLIITILLFSIIDYQFFIYPFKPPFREMATYIKTQNKIKDIPLLNWNLNGESVLETKFYNIKAPIYIASERKIHLPFGRSVLIRPSDIINGLPQDVDSVGVITVNSIDEVNLPGYTKEETKEIGVIKLIVMKKV